MVAVPCSSYKPAVPIWFSSLVTGAQGLPLSWEAPFVAAHPLGSAVTLSAILLMYSAQQLKHPVRTLFGRRAASWAEMLKRAQWVFRDMAFRLGAQPPPPSAVELLLTPVVRPHRKSGQSCGTSGGWWSAQLP